MTHCHLPILFLSISLLAHCARAAEDPAPSTPPEATARLFSALAAKDIDCAIALTAPADIPAEAMRNYYQRLAGQIGRRGTPDVIAHLQLGDTAVVIFREPGAGKNRDVDVDPAYLVRRDGKWLVLFKLTEFDRPDLGLEKSTLAGFKKLQEWFDSQKTKLQELLADVP